MAEMFLLISPQSIRNFVAGCALSGGNADAMWQVRFGGVEIGNMTNVSNGNPLVVGVLGLRYIPLLKHSQFRICTYKSALQKVFCRTLSFEKTRLCWLRLGAHTEFI